MGPPYRHYPPAHVEEDRQAKDPQQAKEGQPRQAPQHRPEIALAPELDELTIVAEPRRWREIGFRIEDDVMRIGTVAVRFWSGLATLGALPDEGIASWSLHDIASEDDVDGLPTYRSTARPVEPDEHPNGTLEIDHVVVMSHNPRRTAAALEQRGFETRRVRDAGNGMEQTFFKTREVVLELIGPKEPSPEHADKRAHFYGLAFTVADIDATAAFLGGRLGRVKDAVQKGRKIATLRKEAGAGLAVAFMSPGPAAV